MRLIGPRRRLFQWAMAALVALIPFVGINGQSLLRLDIPSLTLELLGHRFRIEELYLVWLFVLWLIFMFILMAMTLGRVWCGWGCPQTALCDLADSLPEHKTPRAIRYPGYLLLSLWVGMTFVWYFISPFEFFSRLLDGRLGPWPTGTAITVAALVMADLTLVRRLFCRAFCPYGRFQTVLTDQGTLTLQAPGDQLGRCIDCKSCLRVCPTGIDIRAGFQIECINCARCLDACRLVMAKRGEAGIIRYTFGPNDLGWRAILTTKTLALALLVVIIGGTALFLASHRAIAGFEIGRSATVASRLTEGGRQRTFFSGSIVNRRERPQLFTLTAADQGGKALAIKGPTLFNLAGSEKRDLTLAVDTPIINHDQTVPFTFTLATRDGGFRIEIPAYLTPVTSGGQSEP